MMSTFFLEPQVATYQLGPVRHSDPGTPLGKNINVQVQGGAGRMQSTGQGSLGPYELA